MDQVPGTGWVLCPWLAAGWGWDLRCALSKRYLQLQSQNEEEPQRKRTGQEKAGARRWKGVKREQKERERGMVGRLDPPPTRESPSPPALMVFTCAPRSGLASVALCFLPHAILPSGRPTTVGTVHWLCNSSELLNFCTWDACDSHHQRYWRFPKANGALVPELGEGGSGRQREAGRKRKPGQLQASLRFFSFPTPPGEYSSTAHLRPCFLLRKGCWENTNCCLLNASVLMPFEVASAIWKPPKCPSPADGCTQFTYAEPQAHPRWQAQLAAVAPSHHGLIRPLPPSSSLPTLAASPHLTPRPPSAHCRWATAPSQGSFNSGEPTSWQSGKLPFSPDPPAPLCLPSSPVSCWTWLCSCAKALGGDGTCPGWHGAGARPLERVTALLPMPDKATPPPRTVVWREQAGRFCSVFRACSVSLPETMQVSSLS